jgi:ribosomal protein L11 methyltransferase
VAVARNNAIRNSTRPYVHPVKARGTRHPAIKGRYDLILANILAGPLKRLAGEISRVTAPGGTLVLSGLLARDVPGVLASYQAHGFRFVRHDLREGWSTLLLRRHGG